MVTISKSCCYSLVSTLKIDITFLHLCINNPFPIKLNIAYFKSYRNAYFNVSAFILEKYINPNIMATITANFLF